MRRIAAGMLFLSIVLSIWFGMHWFAWVRLARETHLPGDAQALVAAALVTASFSTLASLFRVAPRSVAGPLWHAAFIWAGFIFLLDAALAGGTVAQGVARAMDPALASLGPTRAVSAAAVGLAVALGFRAWRHATGDVPVKRIDVRLDKLPRALDGFSIVQVSDLHVSPSTTVGHVQRIVDKVNAEQPDLIAVTGDLVDGTPELLDDRVAPLASLTARTGVYFVTGNHEYYSGADRWLSKVRSLGMRTLQNERVSVGRDGASFDLVGIPDLQGARYGWGHVPRLADALSGRDPSKEVVLLAHQPRQFPEAAKMGVGLQISGHTHGGQLWPFTWLVRLAEPRVAGLYREGASQLYVSRGTGFWGPPMRLGSPQEITQITLRSAEGDPA